jgi:hypothetical protein
MIEAQGGGLVRRLNRKKHPRTATRLRVYVLHAWQKATWRVLAATRSGEDDNIHARTQTLCTICSQALLRQ